MRAARWDTTWKHGGLWRRVLRRRLRPTSDPTDVETIAWTEPTVMRVYQDDGTTLAEITGTLANDDLDLILARTSTQTTEVEPGRYRHCVFTRNPDLDDDEILLDGWVTVEGTP